MKLYLTQERKMEIVNGAFVAKRKNYAVQISAFSGLYDEVILYLDSVPEVDFLLERYQSKEDIVNDIQDSLSEESVTQWLEFLDDNDEIELFGIKILDL